MKDLEVWGDALCEMPAESFMGILCLYADKSGKKGCEDKGKGGPYAMSKCVVDGNNDCPK